MKVYLTAENSFLTKNYKKFFVKKGWEIYYYNKTSNIKDILKIQPDIIIHCAAEIYKEEEMFNSNIKLTYDLLELSRQINYKRFIYIGSSSEYGTKNEKIRETMPLEPTTLYGATKACGTLLCQAYSATYNKPIFCFRPLSVFGPEDKEHKFIPTLCNAWLNNSTFNLTPDPVHDWIYIDDFIDATMHIVENYPEISFDIINIGSGMQFSNLEVVKTFEKAINATINYKLINNLAKKYDTTKMWCADVEKLQKRYNFTCKHDLLSGLIQYANFKKTRV